MGNTIGKEPNLFAEAAIDFIESLEDTPGRKTTRNEHRRRGHALEELDRLSDEMFARMFRMSRAYFDKLLALISPLLPITDVAMAELSSGSSICNRTKLAVTLRWLAGGSYLDLCFGWAISKTSFFSDRGVVWPVLEAINQALEIGLPLNDVEELNKNADEFLKFSQGKFSDMLSSK